MCALEIVGKDKKTIFCSNRTSGEFSTSDKEVLISMAKESGRDFLNNFFGNHAVDGFFLIRKDNGAGLNVSSKGRFNGRDFDEVFSKLNIEFEGNEIKLRNGVVVRACCNLD